MRDARVHHRPKLTMIDVGQSPLAPRTWSHSHISKVERGHEWPKEDLVAWYEAVCELEPGTLMALFDDAVGYIGVAIPEQVGRASREWAPDRIELHGDLRGPRMVMTEQHDLICQRDGSSGYVLIVDLGLDADNRANVLEGGVALGDYVWRSERLGALAIDFGRPFAKGEWRRLVVRHEFDPVDVTEPWLTVANRSFRVREAVVSSQFATHRDGELFVVDGVNLDELHQAFDSSSPHRALSHHPCCRPLAIDAQSRGAVRFKNLQPGLHYGLAWV